MLKIGLITLGCPKNQVDSELMLGDLSTRSDVKLVEDINEADVIIINTCGFIQDAKEESIEAIIEAGRLKKDGNCQALIVTGCLTQRYQDEILKEMPEVDAILGTGTFDQIGETIDKVLKGERISNIGNPSFSYKSGLPRVLTDSQFAYVKIAEGCSNNCTYCSIPRIRGPFKSRPLEDIYTEVKMLADQGIKEVILVAQDTTQYGIDIYGKPVLSELLKRLVTVEKISWIRLMYSYPEFISNDLIEIIAREEKICNYLDLPVQHSADRIRKLMNRKGKRKDLVNLIKRIRHKIPDTAIRTSLIVGFPGEDEDDFEDLVNFVQEIKFDRLGVFKYSPEEETVAASLPGKIPDVIKEERYNKIMEIQQEIAYRKNQELIGRILPIIIDEIKDNTALARSQYDAPEIDNQIYLPADNLKVGDIVKCRIKEAFEYDLIGERDYEFAK